MGQQETCCSAALSGAEDHGNAAEQWRTFIGERKKPYCGKSWFKQNCEASKPPEDAEDAKACNACRTCFARGCDYLPEYYFEKLSVNVRAAVDGGKGAGSISVNGIDVLPVSPSWNSKLKSGEHVTSSIVSIYPNGTVHLTTKQFKEGFEKFCASVPIGNLVGVAIVGSKKNSQAKVKDIAVYLGGANEDANPTDSYAAIARKVAEEKFEMISEARRKKNEAVAAAASEQWKQKDAWKNRNPMQPLLVQYTGESKPGLSTPEDKWCTVGTVYQQTDSFYYSRFLDSPIRATAVRIVPTEPLAMIDEVQVFGEAAQLEMDPFGGLSMG